MKLFKKTLTGIFILFATLSFSQKDRWDSIYNNSPLVANVLHFTQNGATVFNNKIVIWGDSTDAIYQTSGIKSFDPASNSMVNLSYTKATNDGGLSSAVAYGSSDLYFGMKNSTLIIDNPNVYHYNSGSVSSLSLSVTNQNEYSGISNLVMFSANSNVHDTLIAFARNSTNSSLEIFKHKVGDPSFTATSHTLALLGVDKAIVYKDTLFIAYYDGLIENLLYSVDGINYTPIVFQTTSLNGQNVKIMDMDTLNGKLYFSIHQENSNYYNIEYANNATELVQTGSLTSILFQQTGAAISFEKHKNELWFNTALGALGKAAPGGSGGNTTASYATSSPLVYRITSSNNIILSQDSVGLIPTDVPQTYQLASVNNELIMAGDFASNFDTLHYGSKFYKLVSPVAGFTNTPSTVCLNSYESFSSSCLGTDSVRWVFDTNTNYAADASATSTLNVLFSTPGNHTIGIIAIGGTQKDTFKINVFVIDATITVIPSSTVVCGSAPASLSATGPANAIYVWEPGTLSGPSQTVSITGNTTYTVTGTTSGCTNSQTVDLFYLSSPIITLSPSLPSICKGDSITITATIANGTTPYIYAWSNGDYTPSIKVSPSVNTIYSVTGTDYNGCFDTQTTIVVVNAVPVISISSSSSSLCAGSSATLTASGALTYTWDAGSSSNPLVDAPLLNTTYSVIGTSAAGCTNTATSSIIVNALKTISGNISVAGSTVAVAGDVTLYAYLPMYTKFDSIASTTISGSGAYTFTAPIADGQYIVKATPSANTLQITYGNSDVNWKTASIFTHGCIVPTTTANISVIPLTPIIPGPGSLSGLITQGPGYGQKSIGLHPLSTPIKGIIVKGGKNPGGTIVAQTTTDANGTYTLSGLPNDNYFILVDVPGLDTNNTYHKVIAPGSINYTNLDFTIDSAKINPINLSVGIKELNLGENNISVFPNPANGFVYINFKLTQSSSVKIDLVDVIGQSIKTIVNSNDQPINAYQTTASLENLSAGVYFIKLKINNKEQVVKLFISQ